MSAPIDYTKEWINKADHDLGSAKIIYQYLSEYYDTIAFHREIEYMSKEELEEAIGIAQEFREFAIRTIGIIELEQ